MDIPAKQKCDALRFPDLQVQDEGSIILLHPRTDTGAKWIGENVADDAQFWGSALVVEHRYIEDIVNGAIEAGLKVV